MNSDQVFGVYCDESNKIHYYNCAPIKHKQSKLKPWNNPIRKIFYKIFNKESSGNNSCSDLSITTTDSKQ
uniref:Transposase n=1 Tax=Heterorhabditis bacteriophora TaxID=37862 RepID=A0A1I7XGS6_HETBA